MGKVPWGVHVGFHVGVQLSGYGEGHHKKVPWGSMLVSMQGAYYIAGSYSATLFSKSQLNV